MSPQPSPKFTVTSIKWQLKGTVVNSAFVFQTLKCFCAEGHHLVHAETAVWHLSAAPEKATLQLASGDAAWLLREWKVFLQVPLSDVPVLKDAWQAVGHSCMNYLAKLPNLLLFYLFSILLTSAGFLFASLPLSHGGQEVMWSLLWFNYPEWTVTDCGELFGWVAGLLIWC